jgi:rhomboid protease GluP
MPESSPSPLPQLAAIPAYSRRQAMDWSLVLASQGIEATIERSPDQERWQLLVRPDELERAQNSIRLYRAENRGWSWRQELPGSDLELHWGAIVFAVFLTLFHSLSTYQVPELVERGLMDNVKVHAGQWWRLFTPIFLHGDLAHLMANITFGIVVLGLSMARFGAGVALLTTYLVLTTYLAGAVGNMLGLSFYSQPYKGLGASGMMMGALGVITIHSIGLWRDSRKASRYIMSGIGAGLLLFVLFGVDAKHDILAHLGGFVAGLVFGAILSFTPEKILRHRFTDPLALFFFVTISTLVWILALR